MAQKLDPLDFKRGLGGGPQDVTSAPTPLGLPPLGPPPALGPPPGGPPPGPPKGQTVTLQTLDDKLNAILSILQGPNSVPGGPPPGPPGASDPLAALLAGMPSGGGPGGPGGAPGGMPPMPGM